ncbi:uncharacterized protein L203_104511 [Cryptococcus depauperatus CBS 7841]|uniref:Uncharacterized protein n=1 Tax=Cryptococcus depauperatus CBS 7841 TaxID=1295531 RepID=A0AAJ8M1N0_9TREE
MGSAHSHAQADPSPGPASCPSASPLGSHPPGFFSLFQPAPEILLTHDHRQPTLDDIDLVITYLGHLGLPLEMATCILDMAEYWSPCRRESRKDVMVLSTSDIGYAKNADWNTGQEHEVPAEAIEQGGGLYNTKGQLWYMVSSPIGCTNGQHSTHSGPTWARRVIVETFSRDQGWSNFAEYYALLRKGQEVPGSRTELQHNVHGKSTRQTTITRFVAGQYYKSHLNILDGDHPIIRLAQQDDRVVLWVRAMYPGWGNWIREGAVTVYSAPFAGN